MQKAVIDCSAPLPKEEIVDLTPDEISALEATGGLTPDMADQPVTWGQLRDLLANASDLPTLAKTADAIMAPKG